MEGRCLQEMKERITCSFISCTAFVSCRASCISDILAWPMVSDHIVCLFCMTDVKWGEGEDGEEHLLPGLPLLHSFLLLQNSRLHHHHFERMIFWAVQYSYILAFILAGSIDEVGLVLAATRAGIFTETWPRKSDPSPKSIWALATKTPRLMWLYVTCVFFSSDSSSLLDLFLIEGLQIPV